MTIPAGVAEGMQVTVRGEGHAAARGGVNGDLLVVIEELPHDKLKRKDNNLYYSHIISVTDAILGTSIVVPCLDGNYKLNLEPGTQSGTELKLRGKGLPSVNGYGRGDLYVNVLVWIPRKLSRSERESIEALSGSESVKPNLSKDDKIIFDRIKKKF